MCLELNRRIFHSYHCFVSTFITHLFALQSIFRHPKSCHFKATFTNLLKVNAGLIHNLCDPLCCVWLEGVAVDRFPDVEHDHNAGILHNVQQIPQRGNFLMFVPLKICIGHAARSAKWVLLQKQDSDQNNNDEQSNNDAQNNNNNKVRLRWMRSWTQSEPLFTK